MKMTLETLNKKIDKVEKSLERYREDSKSTNWEIANGSKVFLKHSEEELEILQLAKLGILSQHDLGPK